MDSTSKTTCSVRTSATLRGNVITGSGRTGASRPTNRSVRFIHRTGPPVTVWIPPTGAHRPTPPWRHASSGWGEAPLGLGGEHGVTAPVEPRSASNDASSFVDAPAHVWIMLPARRARRTCPRRSLVDGVGVSDGRGGPLARATRSRSALPRTGTARSLRASGRSSTAVGCGPAAGSPVTTIRLVVASAAAR